ncbi:MAG: 50S ribosomal protein L4 [Candidatus Nealsonbacteria bacterium]|nr:50S ribosomal protein L4 [Candidatus Nealsonbacteria bacterium]
MKTQIFDQTGKEIGQALLPKEIFGLELSSDLVYQTVFSQTANRRQGSAHTKDRGEVSGGGKKPWRQKGTGRARHGSIRSPLWKGGGVTFGPNNAKVFKKKINKKSQRKALLMVLSAKAQKNLIVLVDKLKIEKPRTKEMGEILKNLPCKEGKCLIVLPVMDKNIILSARNLENVKVMQAKDLNVLDALSCKYMVLPKESIKVIKETFVSR